MIYIPTSKRQKKHVKSRYYGYEVLFFLVYFPAMFSAKHCSNMEKKDVKNSGT